MHRTRFETTDSAADARLERVRARRGYEPQQQDETTAKSGDAGSYLIGFLFGGAFVLAGTFIVLVATDLIPTDDSKIHVPRWLLGLIGVGFATPGLYFWVITLKSLLEDRRRARSLKENPTKPWLGDFPWDPTGCRRSGWSGFGKSLFGLVVMTAIFAPLAYFMITEGGFILYIMGGLFGLVYLLMLAAVVHSLARVIKYGGSRVEYESFPYFTGDLIEMLWVCPRGIGSFTEVRFKLRCLRRETVTTTRRQGGRTQTRKRIVQTPLWEDEFVIDEPGRHAGQTEVPVTFQVPDDAPGTARAADAPIVWSLEVRATTPGPDFEEKYDVPVYERSDV